MEGHLTYENTMISNTIPIEMEEVLPILASVVELALEARKKHKIFFDLSLVGDVHTQQLLKTHKMPKQEMDVAYISHEIIRAMDSPKLIGPIVRLICLMNLDSISEKSPPQSDSATTPPSASTPSEEKGSE